MSTEEKKEAHFLLFDVQVHDFGICIVTVYNVKVILDRGNKIKDSDIITHVSCFPIL